MTVQELVTMYDFHDSNVINIRKCNDELFIKIDMCMWKQKNYQGGKELEEVVLHFFKVSDYKWNSKKSEKDIDYDTIIKLSYNDNIVKIVLYNEEISVVNFRSTDVILFSE